VAVGAEFLDDAAAATTGSEEPPGGEIAARSPLQLFWRRLRQDRVALVALTFIGILILIAIFAPLIVKLVGARPPTDQSTAHLSIDANGFPSAAGPSSKDLFGTDGLGRDVFSRVLYGARVSLEVAFIATALIVVIGVTIGMVAGYYRGWIDTVLARSMDVMLAFPVLLLALGLGAACALKGCIPVNFNLIGLVVIVIALLGGFGSVGWLARGARRTGEPLKRREVTARAVPWLSLLIVGLVLEFIVTSHSPGVITPGLPVVIFVITMAGWPYMARIIRGQTLSLREKEFVEAAQSLGASDARILFRHILPNLVAPIIVYTTLLIPTNILFEAALSFLGVGVQPPNPSWGSMLADATDIFDTAWWFMTFPGLALLLTVLSFNLVGDGMQDALNPRTGR
jgi:ABC-type dipeptide/oligopeptide/nickel transport system permease subunit